LGLSNWGERVVFGVVAGVKMFGSVFGVRAWATRAAELPRPVFDPRDRGEFGVQRLGFGVWGLGVVFGIVSGLRVVVGVVFRVRSSVRGESVLE